MTSHRAVRTHTNTHTLIMFAHNHTPTQTQVSQRAPSNPATLGANQSVVIRRVASFQGELVLNLYYKAYFGTCRSGLNTGVATFQGGSSHTCIHTCMHTCMHTCIHTCIHTHAYTHAYIHTYIHTSYIHAHTNTHTHTHTHTHTQNHVPIFVFPA